MEKISSVSDELLNDEIKRFSPETRFKLEQEGFPVWQLRGISVFQLKQQGANIFSYDTPLSDFKNYHPELLSQPSRKSEVAFHSQQFILEETKFTFNYPEQLDIIYYSYDRLLRKLNHSDIKVIVGSVADYVDILFHYYTTTGKSLVSITQDSKSSQIRLNTSTGCGYFQQGGHSFSNFLSIHPTLKNPEDQKEEYGMIISECCHCHNMLGKGVAPLIVPK